MTRRLLALALSALICLALGAPAAQADFGFDSFSFEVGDQSATPYTQAGGHPNRLLADVAMNRDAFNGPDENLHDISVDLPPGLIGDPTAIPHCEVAQLTAAQCPGSSQVGALVLTTMFGGQPVENLPLPVYNITPPDNIAAQFGFDVTGTNQFISAGLRPGDGYAVTSGLSNISVLLNVTGAELTLWGVPADASHDADRVCPGNVRGCSAAVPRAPFLRNSTHCSGVPQDVLASADSWQHIGVFDSAFDALPALGGCPLLPFAPTFTAQPDTAAADSPSGLTVDIDLPQSADPDALASADLRDATVTLPEGLTVNPASANGLDACSPAQIALATNAPPSCPDASRIAEAELTTPLLEDPLAGSVYLATPHQNPFDTLLAAYIVIEGPGVLVKIPGRIDADPATGRLTGTFEDNPQLPFSELSLHFKGGAHSTLITPKTCGDYTSSATFSPWSANPAVQRSDAFAITGAPGGGPCASSEAELPNSPGFDAGTLSPISKNYSPFVLHLRRADATQRFSAVTVKEAQGLIAKLAGTTTCSDADLATAASKSGAGEKAAPSCPAASHVGSVVAGAGAGPSPYYAPGEVYLSGPYKGAPLSLATVIPAVAGPFDLGTIVTRVAAYVDPKTAQITGVSDPIPQMLEGIPTDVRTIDLRLDRPDFSLTGTSCDPASIDGLLTSTLGAVASLSSRFQLSDCGRLPFKPRMTLRLRGGTKRGAHPALRIALMPRPGDANIASVSVALPRSEFLENAHIRTVCTRPDFAADNCPAGAVYGEASVDTPLLDYDLTGHVYLRSSDNLLPDVVPDLRGPAFQPIRLESAGRTDSIKGGIRTTIDLVPDAPFTKAVVALQGAGKGLLVNSRDICKRAYRATVRYTAHNGDTYVDRPKLAVKCRRARRGKKRGGKRGGHRRAARGSAVAAESGG